MAELADAMALGAIDRKVVQVQVLFPAPEPTRAHLCDLITTYAASVSTPSVAPKVVSKWSSNRCNRL
jgi:hypothetical protein